jgi:hypothetical protein
MYSIEFICQQEQVAALSREGEGIGLPGLGAGLSAGARRAVPALRARGPLCSGCRQELPLAKGGFPVHAWIKGDALSA